MKSKGIDGAALRIIAMITMLVDHIGWFFLKDHMMLTWIGRIAFPIYAFLLAEGFLVIYRDGERLKKHVAKLIMLTVISELCFDFMEFQLNFTEYLVYQSNMVTLILGLLGMMATEWFVPSEPKEGGAASGKRVAALICIYVLLGFANYMMVGNFNLVGPWLVIAFYWTIRCSREASGTGNSWPWARRFLTILSIFLCYLPFYFWVRSGFGDAAGWWKEVVDCAPWIAGHILSAFIISLYNGALGYHAKWFRRLYYSFYPVHMLVIGIICMLIGI